MFSSYWSADGLRAAVVVVLAFAQCIMAFWPDLRKWPNTTASRSSALDTPVVPVGPTFAIWGLIFASCIAFAVWQALPGNLDQPMSQQIGWIAALVFAANTVWEYVVPRFGMGWTSVLLAVCEFFGLSLILVFLVWGGWGQGPVEWWLVAAPFYLFAGWVTAAVVVNLSSVLRAKGLSVGPTLSILLLLAAGGVALIIAWSTASMIYALTVIWALGGIALAARQKVERRGVLITAAILVVLLAAAVVAAPRTDRTPEASASAQPSLATSVVETEALSGLRSS